MRAAPERGRAARAVDPALRDRRLARRLGAAARSAGIRRTMRSSRRATRPSHRGERRPLALPLAAGAPLRASRPREGSGRARPVGGRPRRALYRQPRDPRAALRSYGMPPNSDYYPVLDLNAARNRFTERSAAEVVALARRRAGARDARAGAARAARPTRCSRAPTASTASRTPGSPGMRELPRRRAAAGSGGHPRAAAKGSRDREAAPARLPQRARGGRLAA